MSVAIASKYLGPSNVRGARVKAWAMGWNPEGARPLSITLAWDHRFNPEKNHALAIQALANKLGWAGAWHLGGTADGAVGVCQPVASLGAADFIIEPVSP